MHIRIHHWLISFVLVSSLLFVGCTNQNRETSASATATDSTAETSAQETVPASISVSEVNPELSNLPRLEGEAVVEMTVNGQPITIVVKGMDAPVTAGNFVDLVNRGVYDGLVFHRVVREPQPFVVQGGDPQSKDPNFSSALLGTGSFIDPATGQPRYVPLEIKPEGAEEPIYSQTLESAGVSEPPELKHTRGAVAMARSNPPDSASSQFYITLADLEFLDGNYAVFGEVTNGMEVVDQIQQGDRIESARVTAGLENLKTSN